MALEYIELPDGET